MVLGMRPALRICAAVTIAAWRANRSGCEPGLSGCAELVVGDEHTAPRVGSGKVRVLATPVMINLIEAAALAAIEPRLPKGYQSLGTRLEVRHIAAATPVGMKVMATAVVTRSSREP